MPPGNSNNKSAVRNKCSYCGKNSCVGSACYVTSHAPRNYEPIRPNFIASTSSVEQNTRPGITTDRVQNQCTFCGKQTCAGSGCMTPAAASRVQKTEQSPVPVAKTTFAKEKTLSSITPITVKSLHEDAGNSSGVQSSEGGRNASSVVNTGFNTNSKINSPVVKSSSYSVSATTNAGTGTVKQNVLTRTAPFTGKSLHADTETSLMLLSSKEERNALADVTLNLNPSDTIKSVVDTSSPPSVSATSIARTSTVKQNVLPKTLSSAGKSHADEESSSQSVTEGRNSLPDVSLKLNINDKIKSPVSSSISSQTNSVTVIFQKNLNQSDKASFNKVPEKIQENPALQREVQNNGTDLSTGKVGEKTMCDHLTSKEVEKGLAHHLIQNSNVSVEKKIQGNRNGSKIVNKNESNCSQDGSECLSSFNEQRPRKHCTGAVMYEGVVVKHLDLRVAMLRVTSPGARNKTVQLFVNRLLLPKSENFYSINTDIKSVLCIRDTVKFVCTIHNKKNAIFDFFAHEAWKVENYNSNKFDNESVASLASHDSLPGSETQGSKSSRSRRRRQKDNDVPQSKEHNLSDAIYHWLDQNDCLKMNNNFLKKVTLKEGCDYVGSVTELRLPYTFIVGVSVDDVLEYVFGIAKNFYPEGPNSRSVEYGVKVDSCLHVGYVVVVTVTRSETPKEYEWVVKKAWPFGKGDKSVQFVGNKMNVMGETVVPVNKGLAVQRKDCQVAQIEPQHTTNNSSVTARIDKELCGEIVTLQNTWGLVKENGGLSTYIFLRKNAFLFGVCLQNYVLDGILDEGQLVTFTMDNGEDQMYAKKMWYGDKLFNFYSFEKVLREYCEEMRISLNYKNSLIKLGEEIYLKK